MNPKIPSQREIRNRLGPTLADAFFELSNPTIKTFVGITPPLNGPKDQLWHSPSDQLIGKNHLKAPVPTRITQAATHKGVLGYYEVTDDHCKYHNFSYFLYFLILELGEQGLKDFETMLEKKIRASMFAEIKDIQLLIEAEQRRITNFRIEKINNECARRLQFLAKEYDKKLEVTFSMILRFSFQSIFIVL